ncbi:DUF423 domain-containing protein [Rheinheimera sp. UJ51]|uniref:DUF423 domain-containing protein n=1 Tax=Rheinheimera sp. UJ51 TaxID=2892446 RepID=UPI001E52EC0E|nr:DUF423 domain-containing protein [Rheinheimera sp. UJ51]MCC5452537.1 DUF423 domain-containing protein [Rheinheimera sp. UJ51]
MQFWMKLSRSLAALYGAAVVALAALLMHLWQSALSPDASTRIVIALALLALHSLALLQLDSKTGSRLLALTAVLWQLGIWLFCWTLLAGALQLPGYFSALAPLGGQSFILGWLVFAIANWRRD